MVMVRILWRRYPRSLLQELISKAVMFLLLSLRYTLASVEASDIEAIELKSIFIEQRMKNKQPLADSTKKIGILFNLHTSCRQIRPACAR